MSNKKNEDRLVIEKFLLALFMCVTSTALFAGTISVEGVYYTLNSDGTATVALQSGYWNPSGDIVIPEEIEDEDGKTYTVTEFTMMAFMGSSITSISIPRTITSWGMFCLSVINTLQNITFADELTTIGANSCQQNQALEMLDLSNTQVTSIGNQAFYDCEALTTALLPSTLTSLGHSVFSDCVNLVSITCLAETPPSVTYSYAGENVPFSTCVLYVPMGSKDAYSTAYYWEDFNIVEIDMTGIESVSSDDAEVTGYYTIDGKAVDAPQKGMNIIRYTDGTMKKIYVK